MTVRTRFAPSPTGYLHIGGVRTALFNWLFARHHGGSFILRIDDTDQQRNVDEALEPILRGLKWLGIVWDEGPHVGGPCGPYFQSQRLDRYQSAVEELLARGAAYRDYALPEEIQAERDSATARGERFVYSRRWMAKTPDDAARFESQGRQGVVRLLMPREGKLVVVDLIRGRVEFEWAGEQDHVVQRADGSCLYHLATVIDDHDFRISHVIRAEEHLSNTPRQVFIAQRLGHAVPAFAHLPLVAEPGSRTKLSKRKLDKYLKNADFAEVCRHGQSIAQRLGLPADAATFNPVIVDFYRAVGYLPEAVVNYLVRLGWSLDDRTEILSREQMVRLFSLDRVGRGAASFDPAKLMATQQHYMQQLSADQKSALSLPFLIQAGLVRSPVTEEVHARVRAVVTAAGARIRVAGDILDYGEFFLADDQFPIDEAAFEKRIRKPPEAAALLRGLRVRLAEVEPFQAAALEEAVQRFADSQGVGMGQVVHALRVALTGKPIGFGLYDCLAILGRDSSLARIERALSN